jgi:hypothetical protein
MTLSGMAESVSDKLRGRTWKKWASKTFWGQLWGQHSGEEELDSNGNIWLQRLFEAGSGTILFKQNSVLCVLFFYPRKNLIFLELSKKFGD